MKLHPDGWPYIAIAVALNALVFVLAGWAGWIFVPLTVWCAAFFRDPDREVPKGSGLIVSPADGVLLPVAEAAPPPELGLGAEPRIRLSIFMNVFNVHVNRVPADGVVSVLAYHAGRFLNASFDKASEHNERMSVALRLPNGQMLAFVQIAGLVARRIRCDLLQEQTVRRGERFGIIRFGSRLDVYLPAGAVVQASAGQRTRAGETVLALLDGAAHAG
ncbi:MAG TPA: phosphatidylserine decarboxylase [Bryobacteraceae bacterium]|jgi:phosphatidylserine decarboxylase|nr:phosphatidylserine decarboxylase [Bryobacteraceae bacterium]HWA04756.1 phosphatidylserine decarboxylase [Rhizomicrobium sp.]